MTIGCVVIGRNEGERLVRCLASVQRSGLPIVYVDSGSHDGSVTAAREMGATVVELDMGKPFTAARARNAGYDALKLAAPGLRFVQFVDGDCELAAGWIEAANAALGDRADIAAVCGRRRERYPEASVYNRLCDIEWNTPVGEAAACGGDSLMRAEAFDAVGGFRPEVMAGEEPELCARLRQAGWKIWRIDAEMTLHDAAMTRFRQWWGRGVRSGFGYAQVWNEMRGTPAPLYGRELARALLWAGLIPLAGLAAAVIHPAALLLVAAIYLAQIARIASTRGIGQPLSWTYGFLMLVSKFAELGGAARFFFRNAGHARTALIEYK